MLADDRRARRYRPNLHGKECDEEGPPPLAGSGLSSGSYRGRPEFNVARWFGSESQTSRFLSARRSGERIEVGATPPDADGLRSLAQRLARHDQPVRAAIESMNGARFVHDQLELAGWQVEIADALKVKGLAPLACKTDRIDAWVLAELCRRDLVPAIWLPDPSVRAERERARFRLHLVRHRSSLKQRVHAVLLAHGKPCPVSDLFGVSGRALLERLALPDPWSGTLDASLQLIDELDRQITTCEANCAGSAPTTATCRCSAPYQGSAGCSPTRSRPRSARSTASPRRESSSATPASAHASINQATRPSRPARQKRPPLPALGAGRSRRARLSAPAYRDRYQRTKTRIGKQRGAKVAQIDLARRLTEAIWHMLTRGQPFAPEGATDPLAA